MTTERIAGGPSVREDSVALEEERLPGIEVVEDYPSFHERHRIFPALFEDRGHTRILDVAAGAGCAAQRIQEDYPAELVCNDGSPTAIKILQNMGLSTVSFDLDDETDPFPYEDGSFDAVVALATIEHMINVDHFVEEIHRILSDDGYFYVSAPNYNGLNYVVPFLLRARHFTTLCPLQARRATSSMLTCATSRTVRCLEYVSSFGFVPEAVYLAIPEGSTRYLALYERSKLKALAYRYSMKTFYTLFSRGGRPSLSCASRRAPAAKATVKPRKVVL